MCVSAPSQFVYGNGEFGFPYRTNGHSFVCIQRPQCEDRKELNGERRRRRTHTDGNWRALRPLLPHDNCFVSYFTRTLQDGHCTVYLLCVAEKMRKIRATANITERKMPRHFLNWAIILRYSLSNCRSLPLYSCGVPVRLRALSNVHATLEWHF